jgi:hypothetical protein
MKENLILAFLLIMTVLWFIFLPWWLIAISIFLFAGLVIISYTIKDGSEEDL